jgi:hypothetical protein
METELHPNINPVVTNSDYTDPTLERSNGVGGLPSDHFTETNNRVRLDADIAAVLTWEIVERRGDEATICPVESTVTINGTTHAIERQKLICTVKAEFIGHNKKDTHIKP